MKNWIFIILAFLFLGGNSAFAKKRYFIWYKNNPEFYVEFLGPPQDSEDYRTFIHKDVFESMFRNHPAWESIPGSSDMKCVVDDKDFLTEFQSPQYKIGNDPDYNAEIERTLRNREIANVEKKQEEDSLAAEQFIFQRTKKKVDSALYAQGKEIDYLKDVIRSMCFPGDTLVSVKDNDSKKYRSVPISSLQVGDSVMSCYIESDQQPACEIAQVQRVIPNIAHHLLKISFSEKVIRATDDHPFYVFDKGWVNARDLRINDRLLSISGKPAPIQNIESEEGEFEVYNLEVSENHNYYACDVLVHNCNSFAVEYPDEVMTADERRDAARLRKEKKANEQKRLQEEEYQRKQKEEKKKQEERDRLAQQELERKQELEKGLILIRQKYWQKHIHKPERELEIKRAKVINDLTLKDPLSETKKGLEVVGSAAVKGSAFVVGAGLMTTFIAVDAGLTVAEAALKIGKNAAAGVVHGVATVGEQGKNVVDRLAEGTTATSHIGGKAALGIVDGAKTAAKLSQKAATGVVSGASSAAKLGKRALTGIFSKATY